VTGHHQWPPKTVRTRWGRRHWIELRAGDRLEVDVHFRNASSVDPPKDLVVVSVAFSGDKHLITYEARVDLSFHTDSIFPDHFFNEYRQELRDFYEYRQRILTGEIGRAHRAPVRAPVVHGSEPDL
jgi:hypothetical protein